MADNVPVVPAGTKVATDYRNINSAGVHVQRTDEIGASAIQSSQVNPTSSATLLAAARDTRKRIILVNHGTVPVYIGPPSVTTSTGMKIPAEASLTLSTTAAVYGIVAAGPAGEIHVVEEYDA